MNFKEVSLPKPEDNEEIKPNQEHLEKIPISEIPIPIPKIPSVSNLDAVGNIQSDELRNKLDNILSQLGLISDETKVTQLKDASKSENYTEYLEECDNGTYRDKETDKLYDSIESWVKAMETLAKRYEGTADYYQAKADKEYALYKNAEQNGESKAEKYAHYLRSQEYYAKAKECREKAEAIRRKIGQEVKDNQESTQNDGNENSEENVDKTEGEKSCEDKIKDILSSPEGIQNLIEKYPELAEKWEKAKEAIEVLNDVDSTPAERNAAKRYLGQFKGALLEAVTKEVLSEAGLDVEEKQRSTEGESGKTRPDIIAKNNTDYPITVFGITVQPGETISIECKCGSKEYISRELNNHIPNQLSGQEGKRVLLTSKDVDAEKAQDVCEKYAATLVVIDLSTEIITEAIIKEMDKE